MGDEAGGREPLPGEAAGSLERAGGPERPGARPGFERRASNVLLAVFVLSVIGTLIVAGAAPPASAGWAVVALAAGLAALGLSVALDRRVPWAPGAAVVAMWLLLATGLVRTMLALSTGQVSLPLDSVVAAWALAGEGRPALGPVPGLRGLRAPRRRG